MEGDSESVAILAQVHCTLNLSQMAPSVAFVQGRLLVGSVHLPHHCSLFPHSQEEVKAASSVEQDSEDASSSSLRRWRS